jgi:hypothetical protein
MTDRFEDLPLQKPTAKEVVDSTRGIEFGQDVGPVCEDPGFLDGFACPTEKAVREGRLGGLVGGFEEGLTDR